MAYTKTTWKDHVVTRPRTYTKVTNQDGSETFTPAPGEVTQEGTPINAANLNHIEEGVANSVNKVDMQCDLDVNAAANTVDGKLYASIVALGWASDVIES